MRLNYNSVINSLSLGNVSFNFLKEFYRNGVDANIFPIGNNFDFSAYDASEVLVKWAQNSFDNRFDGYSPDVPTFKLWHIDGAEARLGSRQYLYTFHELDQMTKAEVRILNSQTHSFVSSSFSREVALENGVDERKISYVPLGLDEQFKVTPFEKKGKAVNFSIMGKWEKRKHTEKIIKLWISKYGNDINFKLNCLVTNPFFKDKMGEIINSCLGGQRYFNVNFLPYLESNAQVNSFINQNDIDLTGLSGAEGWNLPAFNSAALGKWTIVLNATAHKDWANPENSIMIEPNGQEPCYDNFFFRKGGLFNQGNIYTWDSEQVSKAMDSAVEKVLSGKQNSGGLLLGEKFNYRKSSEIILNKIFN